MNCETYKSLSEKLLNHEISATELKQIKSHIRECNNCKTDYHAIEQMETIKQKLKNANIQLENKDQIINDILNNIDDKPKRNIEATKYLLSRKFKMLISSAAACLIILFMTQQFYLVSKLSRLESRHADYPKTYYSSIIVKSGLIKKYSKSLHFKKEQLNINQSKIKAFIIQNSVFKYKLLNHVKPESVFKEYIQLTKIKSELQNDTFY